MGIKRELQRTRRRIQIKEMEEEATYDYKEAKKLPN